MGRRLPEKLVAEMYGEYLRFRSLDKVAAKYGRSNQALWELFHLRGLPMVPHRRERFEYKGLVYTPTSGGYLRATSGHRKALNRVVWEEANGPIPDGYEIRFKDGNKHNCALDNLELGKKGTTARSKGARVTRRMEAEANEMVEKHIGFVIMMATPLASRYQVPIEDLIQCGRIGIVDAVRRYDAKKAKGGKFISFAKWRIQYAMRAFLRQNARTVRRPAHRLWEGEDISMEHELGEEFRMEDALGIEENVTEEAYLQDLREHVAEVLETLEPRQRQLVELQFFEGLDHLEIAVRFGVSRSAVWQQWQTVKRLLRYRLKSLREAA